MSYPRVLALGLVLLLGCQSESSPRPDDTVQPSSPTDSALLTEVRPGVWVHATYREVEGFGRVRSNGLAVASGDGALLVDAGWSDDPENATETIVDEVRRASGASVARAVLTHYHDDSVAGVGVLRRGEVPTYATSQTADLMVAEGWGRPDSLLSARGGDAWTLPVGDRSVEVFYPGPGHTVDNVVVYVPHARILYGGCLIRPGGTASLGNTADADIAQWAESIARVRDRYDGRIDVVVPSHGPPGGPALLEQTIALVEAHRGRPVGD